MTEEQQTTTPDPALDPIHNPEDPAGLPEETTDEQNLPSATHSPVPVIPQLGVAIFILVALFSASMFAGRDTRMPTPETPSPIDVTATVGDTEEATPPPADPFASMSIVADSAFVWDVATQRALYTKEPDEQLPLASIAKLMTALVAYELLDENDSINISKEDLKQMGNSGFIDGERFSFKNLTDLTLIGSSNDGAHALAAAAGASVSTNKDAASLFIDAMNIRAEEIGLSQTYFNNATGLDISSSEAGAYGSARDVTFLMEYIMTNYPALLDETTEESAIIPNENGEGHVVKNTNNAIRDIQGLIASKTGYTDLAGGNLVVVFEAGLNHPIIITVLGSTYSDRFSDVVLLERRAREALSQ